MAKAQRLAGFPLYIPTSLPRGFDYSRFYAAIEQSGESNEGRGFKTKWNFVHGYVNYQFQAPPGSTLDFFLLSADDAAVLGDEGVFGCSGSWQSVTAPFPSAANQQPVSLPIPIEICGGRNARWWSPDHMVYIAMEGAWRNDILSIANSMMPLDDITF